MNAVIASPVDCTDRSMNNVINHPHACPGMPLPAMHLVLRGDHPMNGAIAEPVESTQAGLWHRPFTVTWKKREC